MRSLVAILAVSLIAAIIALPVPLSLVGCAGGGDALPDPDDGLDGGGGDGGGGGGGGGGGAYLPGLPTQVSSLLWSGVLEVTAASPERVYAVCRHGFSAFDRTEDEGWIQGPHVDAIIGAEPRAIYDSPFVYVADGDHGFLIYSVADPDAPGLANSIRSNNLGAVDLDVRDRRVHVVDPDFGFRIVDTNDIRSLKTVGQFERRGARCIALGSGRAYLGTDDGRLVIVDTSTNRPRSLAEYVLADGARILDLAVDAAVVHAVVEGVGLISVNAAVPTLVQELSRLDLPLATRVTASSDYLYVVERGPDGDAVRVVSVATPDAPQIVSVHRGTARAVASAGSELLVAADREGMYSLDMTDPTAPLQSGGFGGLTGLAHLASRNRLAAVSTDQGVAIVDATDRRSPQFRGLVRTAGPAPRLDLADGLCAIADPGAEGEGDESLLVVPLPSDAPAAASVTPLPGLRDVAFMASTTYLALGATGVATYDLTDAAAPQLVQSLDLAGASADLIEAGRTHLLVVDTAQQRLISVTVNDDGALTEAHRLDLPAAPADIRRIGNYLLLPCGGAGLLVVDVTDDAKPALLGATSLPGQAGGAHMDSGAAYVACGDEGLRLVALDQPASPRPYVFLDTPGYASDAAIDTGVVLLSDGQALLLMQL
ncbi:MAG: hypothetical protein GX134_15105 [candidate division WS1 bacterium]|nr:hypothetical protein [candidate division WS1 bacterium]